MNSYQKYLKYKSKYLRLKNQLGGDIGISYDILSQYLKTGIINNNINLLEHFDTPTLKNTSPYILGYPGITNILSIFLQQLFKDNVVQCNIIGLTFDTTTKEDTRQYKGFDDNKRQYKTEINKCKELPGRFLFFILNLPEHANLLIYDKNTNSIKRYESNTDSTLTGEFDQHEALINLYLFNFFKEIRLDYIDNFTSCPTIGFQYYEIETRTLRGESKISSSTQTPKGFCMYWSWFTLFLQLSHPDEEKIVDKTLKIINEQKLDVVLIIENFFYFIGAVMGFINNETLHLQKGDDKINSFIKTVIENLKVTQAEIRPLDIPFYISAGKKILPLEISGEEEPEEEVEEVEFDQKLIQLLRRNPTDLEENIYDNIDFGESYVVKKEEDISKDEFDEQFLFYKKLIKESGDELGINNENLKKIFTLFQGYSNDNLNYSLGSKKDISLELNQKIKGKLFNLIYELYMNDKLNVKDVTNIELVTSLHALSVYYLISSTKYKRKVNPVLFKPSAQGTKLSYYFELRGDNNLDLFINDITEDFKKYLNDDKKYFENTFEDMVQKINILIK